MCGYDSCSSFSDESVHIDFPLMVLLRKTPFGIYGYAPKAPSVKISESEYGILLEEIALAVKPFLPPQTICIRFDTIWKSPYVNSEIQQGNESQTSRTDSTGEIPRNEIRELRMNYGTQTHLLKKTKRNHFCPDTVIINLQHSPEQLLCNMRQTTRNCVRRSYRENVIISEKSTDFLPKWYDLYRSTGERKKFYTEKMDYFVQLINRPEGPGRIFFKPVASPHEDCGKGPPSSVCKNQNDNKTISNKTPKNILNPIFQNNQNRTKQNPVLLSNPKSMPIVAQVPEPSFHILAAEKDNIVLSAMILAVCGKNAYYMYSGSNPEYPHLMAGYGLQWEAMLFARKSGCVKYDLLGIPPNGNPSHPMNGLYTFKTGFGGEVTRLCGCWDYPYQMEKYNALVNSEEFAGKQ